MIENYFAVEPAIVNHLKAAMPDLAAIYTPSSIEEMLKITNLSPSVSVIYLDTRIGDSAGNGKAVSEYQQWLLVLSLRNAQAQLQDTAPIRNEASPHILRLLRAMQGFDPKVIGFRNFKRVTSSVRHGASSGHAYFPFMFEVQTFI